MKVKVCGITSYEDARLALDLGADALGFNCYPGSPRYIDPHSSRSIIRRLPPFSIAVGLFVNASDPVGVEQMARFMGVQVLQFHGDETPDYCRRFNGWPVIKAVRIGTEPIRENLDEFPAQAFLLDSKDDALYGGTGKTFAWNLAAGIALLKPIILAGGLRAENVGEAVRFLKPYAVDVCSGVEYSPGKKDPAKLRDFMNEVANVCRGA
jgi:phosphoribosylanthranilate isomerase